MDQTFTHGNSPSMPEMRSTGPRVYARLSPVRPISIASRLIAMVVAVSCIAPLVIATFLTPSKSGVGTHTRLGLEPCGLIRRAGIPCATCGMTTSYSYFVRGNLPASFYVQPMGFILALLCAIGFWAALYIAVSSKPVYRLIWIIPARYYVLPLLLFATAAWAWKIFIFVKGIDGWR